MTVRPNPDVIIIGAGPSGLTAAAGLAKTMRVVVLEREQYAGGIPRHSDHLGYGIRDLHRFVTGPEYARRLVARAESVGVVIRTGTMVTGWTQDGRLEVTSPAGREALTASAIVLATGARERPRAARLVPGDRPAGVFTTGQLQNLVHLHHRAPGGRAVIVGAELVSWSAALTLRGAGCRTVLMTTEHPTPESYAAFNAAGRLGLRVPIATHTRVIRIIGRPRLTGIEVENTATGQRRIIGCDTVVFTGDWIPDNELAVAAGLNLDTGSKAPIVDGALRTSRDGVFAVGNLVHPVVTADLAAMDGQHVVSQVQAWLNGSRARAPGVRLMVQSPLRWVSPGLLRLDDPLPARHRLVLWTNRLVRRPHVHITQGGKQLTSARLLWPASPGRAFQLPSRLLSRADMCGPDIVIGLGDP